MKFCEKCGKPLTLKECGLEGKVAYCNSCKEFKFPTFNSAISAIVFNPTKDKVLLIQQYGRKDNILVAGYINQGENSKEALIREIKEEIDLEVVSFTYNDNEYFKPTNTLIHNYAVTVDRDDFKLTNEVDYASWYDIEEVLKVIKPNSLAKSFVERYLSKDHEYVNDRVIID